VSCGDVDCHAALRHLSDARELREKIIEERYTHREREERERERDRELE
jgi:S-adenosylmethionine/arginine decarboxylase-like enzyme